MKIIVNKREFAALVRWCAASEAMNDCGICPFKDLCEKQHGIEHHCEIFDDVWAPQEEE